MSRAGIGLGVLLVACGGAATPKPETPRPVAADSPTQAPAESSDAAKPADEPKNDDPSGGGGKGVSGDELKAVLQLVIEDAELDKYLRLEESGRFPLKLAGHDVPSSIALTKAGQPVKIVEGEPAKKDAVLVITKIDITPPEATVDYRFDIEGVRGTAHLKKASFGWELTSSRIVEHYRADDAKKK